MNLVSFKFNNLNKWKMINRKIITGIFVFCLVSSIGFAQTLSIGFGLNYTLTHQKKPMVKGMDYFDNTDNSFKFSYEHSLRLKKWSIFGTYTKYEGYTFISFKEGSVITPDGFPLIGNGFNGVNVSRIDLGVFWHTFKKKKFFLKTSISIGLQVSKTNGSEIANLITIDGPDYFELEPIWVKPHNTKQIVPSIGVKMGYVFWKRLELSLQIQGVYGFKSFQNMYFNYSYKGVPQEIAVFEATGTGVFTSLSIGYRFKKE